MMAKATLTTRAHGSLQIRVSLHQALRKNTNLWIQTITGVGQIFYQTELPVLMRNPNTQKIVAYHKNDQGDYEFTTQWDASLPTTDVRTPFLSIPI